MPTVLPMSVLGGSAQRYEVIGPPEETNAGQGLGVRRFAVGAALVVACAFGILSGGGGPRLPVPAGPSAPAADEGLLTTIATLSREESALALRAVLSDAGIRSTVRVPAPHRADVLVFPEDAARARSLAATFPG